MEAIEQVWNWGWFNWWEWDGFYNWPANSYRAGRNIESKQIENGLFICNKLVDTWLTYQWDILAVNPFENRCFSTRDGSTWKIYKDWVFKFNMDSWDSTWNTIQGFWIMNRSSDNITYSYWFSRTNNWTWKITRFSTDFTTPTYNIWTERNLWQWRNTNPNENIMPVLSVPTWIIWAYANTIFKLNRSEIIETLVTLPREVDIVWITFYQNTYKVFYNWPRYSWWPIDSYISIWDWANSLFTQTVKYENSPIRVVVNDWAYEYVVFWNNITSDLYRVWGLERGSPIRWNIEWSTWYNTRVFWTEWVIREWILYLKGTNKFDENCIYSYWNYYPWTNRQLVPENVKNVSKMLASTSNIDIYIDDDAWTNVWKIYTKSFLFNQIPELTGTILSYAMTWNGWLWSRKVLKRVDCSYQLYSNSDSIKIYSKTNWWPYGNNNTWWTLIKTITGEDYFQKRWVTFTSSELSAISVWEFYQLEYKVELIAWWNRSPILYQIKTSYLDYLKW